MKGGGVDNLWSETVRGRNLGILELSNQNLRKCANMQMY